MDLLVIVPKSRAGTFKNLSTWATSQTMKVVVTTPEEALTHARNNPPTVCFVFFDQSTKNCLRILGATGGYPILAIAKDSEAIYALHNGANAFLSTQGELTTDLLLAHYIGLKSLNYTYFGIDIQRIIQPSHSVQYGAFSVNIQLRIISYHNKNCRLTPIEFALFCELVKNQESLVSQRALLVTGWADQQTDRSKRSLFTTIGRLKKKLQDYWPDLEIRSLGGSYILSQK